MSTVTTESKIKAVMSHFETKHDGRQWEITTTISDYGEMTWKTTECRTCRTILFSQCTLTEPPNVPVLGNVVRKMKNGFRPFGLLGRLIGLLWGKGEKEPRTLTW